MKKYSDTYINQLKNLEHAVVGFEFEFYMNSGYTYYRTISLLNDSLSPAQVYGFKTYHSPFVPYDLNFKIENDYSGGVNMVEFITSPMSYYTAKYYLLKIAKFIQQYGYTTDKSSIHMNISFDSQSDRDLSDLNPLKLLLEIDEDSIYNQYPNRKNNVYAKSVKQIIPYKEYNYSNVPIEMIKNNIKIPDDRYYGINFLHLLEDNAHNRLEYRYIGGKDYEKNTSNLLYFLDTFIMSTYNAIDNIFTQDDSIKLEKYLNDNITFFKNFSNYDNFISDFPSISLQIDRNDEYNVVSSYYDTIYTELFNIITSTSNIKDCIINYVTESQKLEIVQGDIKCINTLKNIDFIECNINGIFDGCSFVGCDISNSQFNDCNIAASSVNHSKILNTDVNDTDMNDCYFMDGFMNGSMYGGVFRSGKIGEYGLMDDDVKIINSINSFFDTRVDKSHTTITSDKKKKLFFK